MRFLGAYWYFMQTDLWAGKLIELANIKFKLGSRAKLNLPSPQLACSPICHQNSCFLICNNLLSWIVFTKLFLSPRRLPSQTFWNNLVCTCHFYFVALILYSFGSCHQMVTVNGLKLVNLLLTTRLGASVQQALIALVKWPKALNNASVL